MRPPNTASLPHGERNLEGMHNWQEIRTPTRTTLATNQTWWQHPNWHSNDNNNNTARIPEPATDTFYTQWGNTMHPTKRPNMVRLVLQNFGRWLQWNNNQKNQIIWQFLNKMHINIFLTMENNVAWHCILAVQCLHERTRGWWEATHLSIGHNRHDPSTNPYQPGGVAIISCNWVAHRVAEQDKTQPALEISAGQPIKARTTWFYKLSQGIIHVTVIMDTYQSYNNTGDTWIKPNQTTHPTPTISSGQT